MIKILVLAVLQGIAEFLPISSSGHLVLGKSLLGISEPDATLEIFLHLGTLMSILIFYRRKIAQLLLAIFKLDFSSPDGKEALFILWASIPAGVVGVLFDEKIEALFGNPKLAGGMLLLTGLILLSTLFARPGAGKLNLGNTFGIGIAQALAIVPGISRSGSTISAALWLGIDPIRAAEFSFLLAVPALAGAALLKAVKIVKSGICPSPDLWVGAVVAAIVGYFSLMILIPIVRKGKLWTFGIYCLAVGLAGVLLL